MAKFKIGDKIIGNEQASKHYSYTKTGWIGKVVGVNGDDIQVKDDTSSRMWVSANCFDLYSPAQEKKKKTNDKETTLTNGEVYKLLFNCNPPSCPTSGGCDNCPAAENNGGPGCGHSEKWWDYPFTGSMTAITGAPRKPERNKEHKKTRKKGLEGLCEEYNYSDSAGLEYLAESDLCTTPEQKTALEVLGLLNELIFTHNSDKYKEEEYRMRYTSLLRSLGVSINKEGFAFIKEKK